MIFMEEASRLIVWKKINNGLEKQFTPDCSLGKTSPMHKWASGSVRMRYAVYSGSEQRNQPPN